MLRHSFGDPSLDLLDISPSGILHGRRRITPGDDDNWLRYLAFQVLTSVAPPAAMTNFPAESLWPLRPELTSESTSSTISPLALPRGVFGYFDQAAPKTAGPAQLLPVTYAASQSASPHGALPRSPLSSQVYSPLSPGVRGSAVCSASLLSLQSPQLPPSGNEGLSQLAHQPQSRSLPPTSQNSITSSTRLGDPAMTMGLTVQGATSPSHESAPFASLAAAGHPRSVSADAVNAHPHTSQAVQRLVQQNARIREAWEAERKYLEANRERAEEVYKEERAIMEEERAEWDVERAALLQEITRLRQALVRGGGNPQPAKGGLPVPMTGTRISDLSSPRSPNGPSASTPDFLRPSNGTETETSPVPIVDVQEIHPELEGIPIKATSVQKATFTDTGSQKGSAADTPPSSTPADSDGARSPRGEREQAAQDKAAMPAGNAPNRSTSTMAKPPPRGADSPYSDSGDNTPVVAYFDGTCIQRLPVIAEEDSDYPSRRRASVTGIITKDGRLCTYPFDRYPRLRERHQSDPDLLLADEDPELTGPLTAHDDKFFQKLTDKLAEVSKDDESSLPAVLKDAPAGKKPDEPVEKRKVWPRPQTKMQRLKAQYLATKRQSKILPTGDPFPVPPFFDPYDSGSDNSSRDDTPRGDEGDRMFPMRLKRGLNFGTPFGEYY